MTTNHPHHSPRVVLVHRIGAGLGAAVLLAFAAAGLSGGLAFFSTQGPSLVGGLSSNGLLSTISIVTAVVLIAAAIRGGRTASTLLIVIGGLFLVSAFVNLALIGTAANILAFRLPNVFFSIGAGLVLLVVGAYGRISGKLPDDNPYYPQDADEREAIALPRQPTPVTAAEAAADRDMAAAEVAVAQGMASRDQASRVDAIHELRTHEDRRRGWMQAG